MEIYSEKLSAKYMIIEWFLTLLINAFALYLASKIFKGFYVESYLCAIVASIVIMLLNKTIKPLLKILTLPITVISLGILYPIVDTIILKIAGLIMGDCFIAEGWFVPFIVAIFIGSVTVLLDATITKVVVRSGI
mgnify:CR=1 FL=1